MLTRRMINAPLNSFRMVSQAIFWPHVVVASLLKQYKESWKIRICPDESCITHVWTSVAGHPALDSDALRSRSDLTTRCIPIRVHGDGTPVTALGKPGSKFMDIWNWSSILGTGDTKELSFLIYAVFKVMVYAGGAINSTYSAFAKRLKWSLMQMWTGRWATHDEFGTDYVEAIN